MSVLKELLISYISASNYVFGFPIGGLPDACKFLKELLLLKLKDTCFLFLG